MSRRVKGFCVRRDGRTSVRETGDEILSETLGVSGPIPGMVVGDHPETLEIRVETPMRPELHQVPRDPTRVEGWSRDRSLSEPCRRHTFEEPVRQSWNWGAPG